MFLFPLSCGVDTENGPSQDGQTKEQTVHLGLCDDMLAGEGWYGYGICLSVQGYF
jgi:hypothetical protein